MSSIIDALKKSDQDRSNDPATRIDQIKFGQQKTPPSRRGFWWLVLLLLLLALAALAWQQGWLHAAKNSLNNWLAPAEVTQQPNQDQVASTESKGASSNQKPTNKLTPPKQADIKAKTANRQKPQPLTDTKAEPVADTDPATTTEDDEAERIETGDQSAQMQTLTVVDSDATSASESLVTAPKNDPSAKPDQPAPQPTVDRPTTANQQQHLLLHQLDFEIRKSIPEIRLNIHIFDPDPAKRMVLINGVKFVTGDVIEELVTVDEISQEGVVLKYGDSTFLIPK